MYLVYLGECTCVMHFINMMENVDTQTEWSVLYVHQWYDCVFIIL